MNLRRELEAWANRPVYEGSYDVVGSHAALTLTLRVVDMEIMRLKPAGTLEDIENLRLIRNECREYMTSSTAEISQEQQLIWWQNVAGSPHWHTWLVYVPGWDEPVGFAMLRRVVQRWYATLGLRQWMRGQGYGRLIYLALLELAPDGEVWAVIRESNVASVRAAEKAGYMRGAWDVAGQVALVGRRA